jgi:hypothetical protein
MFGYGTLMPPNPQHPAVKLGLYLRIEAIQFFGRNPVENGFIM